MSDYFLRIVRRFVGQNLESWRRRFKGVRTTKQNILVILTLVLCMRLFFYAVSDDNMAHAQQSAPEKETNAEVDPEVINPLYRIKTESDKLAENRTCIDMGANAETNDSDILYFKDKNNDKDGSGMEAKCMELIGGTPMEKMAPRIAEKDEKVAAYLVAIAKKESDWGRHAPTKNGQDCYNYWGFKGGYNLTDSGYSCFDSPEQAVDMVGERIQNLVDKKIDTPEKMVVWKCGSSCAGHDPEGVKSWIGAVKTYFSKLIS